MTKQRFEHFNDDELYLIKRAFIEAEKYIMRYAVVPYTDEEVDTINNLLTEAIDNIKYRRDNNHG